MEIKTANNNGQVVITPVGDIDTDTAPALQKVLMSAFDGAGAVELDFSKVPYISSLALGVLHEAHNRGEDMGVPMTLSNVPKGIQALFRMTGHAKVLNVI